MRPDAIEIDFDDKPYIAMWEVTQACDRELVSRNLSRFQAEGILKIDGPSVTVTDLKALESELQSGE